MLHADPATREAVLMCAVCKAPTWHRFARMNMLTYHVSEMLFRCVACGNERRWGISGKTDSGVGTEQ